MREIVEKDINGFRYKYELLGAKLGKKLLARIVRGVGPVIDEFRGDDGEPAAKLCAALKDEDLDYVCDTLMSTTRFSPLDNADIEFLLKDKFDEHFAGRYGSMMLWVKEGLVANFGSFFGELGADLGELKEMLALAMAKSTPSTKSGSGSASSLKDGAV